MNPNPSNRLVEHIIDQFGPERCMFASNLPIDAVSASWTTIYEAFSEIVAYRSPPERDALFHGNAVPTYRCHPNGATT